VGWEMEDPKIVKITDFRLAGFLVARGAKFLGTDTNPKGEVVFSFCADQGGKSASIILNQYPGSPEQSYDSSCKTMHDLVKVALLNRKR